MIRKLIVSADDFGYTEGINNAIVKLVRRGIVRNISVYVHGKHFKKAKKLITRYPKIDLGIHLEPIFPITISKNIEHFDTQLQRFMQVIRLKPVYACLHWSSKFKKLSKKEVSKLTFALKVFSRRHDIYLRGGQGGNKLTFFAEKDIKQTEKKLVLVLGRLVSGINELIVHPGEYPDHELISLYPAILRKNETIALTSEKVLNKIKSEYINITSYSIIGGEFEW